MPRTDRGRLDLPVLADYFRGGFRPREAWLVGMEVEKLGVVAADGAPIPYEGRPASVGRTAREQDGLGGGPGSA